MDYRDLDPLPVSPGSAGISECPQCGAHWRYDPSPSAPLRLWLGSRSPDAPGPQPVACLCCGLFAATVTLPGGSGPTACPDCWGAAAGGLK